ncbi:MAG: hypothetical protein ABW206_14925, partial [Agrobacterium vaccinii]
KLDCAEARGNFRAALLLWSKSLRYDADFQIRLPQSAMFAMLAGRCYFMTLQPFKYIERYRAKIRSLCRR